MLHLTLRQLTAIRSLARTGRVNRSAGELGLTGPAVTLQLKQAEDAVGARLFDRTPAGMVPTEVGQAVIEAAQEVLERLRLLEEQTEALVSGRAGRVRLGAVSTAKYFAPSMIAAFGKQQPGIEVQLLVGNRAETIDRLRHGEIDLVIMGRPPREVPLEASLIGEHPLVVIASPDHPLAGQKAIPRDRLAREHFLLRESGSGTRTSLEMYFADAPERRDNPGVEMGSNESIKQAVMAGLGIALLSAHTVAAEVGQGWLAVLDAEDLPIMRQWFCGTPVGRLPSNSTLALQSFLTGEGATYLPRLAAPSCTA